ncbi:MAG TPA: mersacidin/lichenicidin family type 2 lantibiotic [Herpetosiphonaceae bacterium]
MLTTHIIRAWKDEEYRMSLSEAEQALLPEHPSGLIEISEDAMLIAEEPRTTISTAPFAQY